MWLSATEQPIEREKWDYAIDFSSEYKQSGCSCEAQVFLVLIMERNYFCGLSERTLCSILNSVLQHGPSRRVCTKRNDKKMAFLEVPSKISIIHIKYRAKIQSFQKYNRSFTALWGVVYYNLIQTSWIWILALSLTSCVTYGKTQSLWVSALSLRKWE